jgi:hypothetical protein
VNALSVDRATPLPRRATAAPASTSAQPPTPTATDTPEPLTVERVEFDQHTITDVWNHGGKQRVNPPAGDDYYRRFWDSFGRGRGNEEYIRELFDRWPVSGEEIIGYAADRGDTLPIIAGVGPNVPFKRGSSVGFAELILYIREPELKEQLVEQGLDISGMGLISFNWLDNLMNTDGVSDLLENLDGPQNLLGGGFQTFGLKIDGRGRIILAAVSLDVARFAPADDITLGGIDGNYEAPRDALMTTALLESTRRIFELWDPVSLTRYCYGYAASYLNCPENHLSATLENIYEIYGDPEDGLRFGGLLAVPAR